MERKKIINNCPSFSAVTNINSWRAKSALSNVVSLASTREARQLRLIEACLQSCGQKKIISDRILNIGLASCYWSWYGRSLPDGFKFSESRQLTILIFRTILAWGADIAKCPVRLKLIFNGPNLLLEAGCYNLPTNSIFGQKILQHKQLRYMSILGLKMHL